MRTTRTVGKAVVALGVTLVLGACSSAASDSALGQQDAAASAPRASAVAVPTAAPPLTPVEPSAPPEQTPPAPAPEQPVAPAPPAAPLPTDQATEAPAPPATVPGVDGTARAPLPGEVTGILPAVGETAFVPSAGPYVFPEVTEAAVDRQLAYVLAHWNNYNTARYGNFNDWGGDCMNFVSQSLVARGWTMTAEWYNDWPNNSWSAAWVHVPSFNAWMDRHPETGAVAIAWEQRAMVKVGDVAVFDWEGDGSLDHAQVVSRVDVIDGVVRIWMAGHNNDVDYRDFDTVVNVTYPSSIGWFWSIP